MGRPSAPAPNSGITSALSATHVPASDLAFATLPPQDTTKARSAPGTLSGALGERAELPSAYTAQVVVDVEAEVAAFCEKT
jgi:hypothetical protein